jgi:hypothetical protein
LSQPLIANIHGLNEVKEGGEVDMEVKFEGASQGYEFSSEESEGEENNREVEDNPPDSSSLEGWVKSEGASQGYEFSIEESEGEENNREVKDDPLDSSSPEGLVKCEGENQGYESSSEESVREENNRDKRDTGESIEEEEKGVEDNIGNCVTDEEEDGAVTVLKLSNGVMFRVPVGLPVPKLMGITSPDICSSFSLRCRDTPLASKKSKPSNISSSIGAT